MKRALTSIAAIFVLFAAGSVSAQSRKDPSPCEAVKGKTYIGWSAGKFDENPDAAGASRIVFDAAGKATTRSFLSYRPAESTAVHQLLTAECSTTSGAGGKTVAFLKFKIGAIDAGSAFITSYDGGAKIWAEAATPGRPMKGWMLLLPPPPPTADNLVK